MTRLSGAASQRTLAVIALLVAASQLSGCVVFREPVEYPVRPPTQPGPATAPAPATNPYSTAPSSPVPAPAPVPPPVTPPPATRQFRLGAAASALVAQAHRQAATGDTQLAIGTLERALRIEPDNPLLWIELGELHESAGRFDQAGGIGHKALQLATGDPRAQAAFLAPDRRIAQGAQSQWRGGRSPASGR